MGCSILILRGGHRQSRQRKTARYISILVTLIQPVRFTKSQTTPCTHITTEHSSFCPVQKETREIPGQQVHKALLAHKEPKATRATRVIKAIPGRKDLRAKPELRGTAMVLVRRQLLPRLRQYLLLLVRRRWKPV